MVGDVFHLDGPGVRRAASGRRPGARGGRRPGPDRSVRVASAAGDRLVRVSAPLDLGALAPEHATAGVRDASAAVKIRATRDTEVRAATRTACGGPPTGRPCTPTGAC
ncbi:hypothetical protein GCM10010182_42730 [Actinomadura cremea]|nr:hypothetical protein GCM10010182_42730 [Actinomadura cremea]